MAPRKARARPSNNGAHPGRGANERLRGKFLPLKGNPVWRLRPTRGRPGTGSMSVWKPPKKRSRPWRAGHGRQAGVRHVLDGGSAAGALPVLLENLGPLAKPAAGRVGRDLRRPGRRLRPGLLHPAANVPALALAQRAAAELLVENRPQQLPS